MYGYCGGGVNPGYGYDNNCCGKQSTTFVLIVVLFILLIIVGASFLP
ncbi:YjcZ family sporulation protein [Psychrobacillus sp. FSL H8-0484]